jgi:hypothetical protein
MLLVLDGSGGSAHSGTLSSTSSGPASIVFGWTSVLGNRTNLPPQARARANASNKKLAASFAANVLPIINQIQAAGMTSYRGIATALNASGVRTARAEYHGARHDAAG